MIISEVLRGLMLFGLLKLSDSFVINGVTLGLGNLLPPKSKSARVLALPTTVPGSTRRALATRALEGGEHQTIASATPDPSILSARGHVPAEKESITTPSLHIRESEDPILPNRIENHDWNWSCGPDPKVRRRTACVDVEEIPASCQPDYQCCNSFNTAPPPFGYPGFKVCVDACWHNEYEVYSSVFIQYLGDKSNSTSSLRGEHHVVPRGLNDNYFSLQTMFISRELVSPSEPSYDFAASNVGKLPDGYIGSVDSTDFTFEAPSVEVRSGWKNWCKPFGEEFAINGIEVLGQVEGLGPAKSVVMKNPFC